VRTVAMLGGFAWFTHAGSTVGTAALAGNQVLLQFIAVAAFVLDAFAFIAEKEAGEAVGAGDVGRLRRAMRVTTELSFLAALGFVAAFLLGGPAVIRTFVADDAARRSALAFLPLCAVVPLLGMPAWQLDGVFIGATRGRALRNAALVATGVYIGLDCVLRPALGNLGVWLAFLAHYGLRAAGLAVAVPALFRAVGRSP
jgi:MATE family multidrug resistance protein